MAASFEVELMKFIKALEPYRGPLTPSSGKVALEAIVYPFMERLVQAFVHEGLERCSDIRYNSALVQSLLAIENFSDLIEGHANEYTIRKHVRDVIRMYIAEVNKSRPIKVTDKAQFGVHLEAVGLNIGWMQASSGSERSLVPDGNILVLAATTIVVMTIVLLIFKK
jgi:hypothetical protein